MSDTTVSTSFLSRTRGLLRRALRDVVDSAASLTSRGGLSVSPDLPNDDLARLQQQIDASLSGRGGEASARSNASDLARCYLDLNDEGRLRFMQLLNDEYGIEPTHLNVSMDAVRDTSDDPVAYAKAITALRGRLESPRMKLFRQFNGLEHGIKFLVDLRADLIGLLRDNPELRALDADLKHLLSTWFDAGFLVLHRITWAAPADLLEKLIAYEAVHEIRSWNDMKNRLESDRRFFAFFHPSMPDEPLIFVEVALVNGIARNVQTLLDESAPIKDPEQADSAIFYSISNAQRGLSGVSFGDFLIKQVVERLSARLPNVKTFATLSPIPGFRRWLDGRMSDGAELLNHEQEEALRAVAGDISDDNSALQSILDRTNWHLDPAIAEVMEPILTHLVAGYLLYQRRESTGTALDSVAHFHLSNGARVESINWLGDMSPKGFEQSAGMMVNYLYDKTLIEQNHESYVSGSEIPASSTVRSLL
ncbi:MAG: malonyl-CoA decarboxylase [Alphaproteobacteria bacterium]|jgi:malonyl-CoA decarboxylase|nr:malonyl-CoA decarboxylase [Alphaproteobacteria bacterium]